MQFDQVYKFIIEKMEAGLSPRLTYHNVQHTKNVLEAAEYLGRQENLNIEHLTILKTAALFHDTGFLQNYLNHEASSCEQAREYLPGFKYTNTEIERICVLINATVVPQAPNSKLEEILCDADLYYLGATDYNEKAELLYEELKNYQIISTRLEWLVSQAEFLPEHTYFTKTAIRERSAQKIKNLRTIKNELTKKLPVAGKNKMQENLLDLCFNLVGILISAFALKCFLVPNRFLDGGITGLSLLLHELYHFNLSVMLIVLNLPLIALSYFTVSKNFSIRILCSIVFLSIVLLVIPEYALTSDKLLIAVFGGMFLGLGIGLVMRAGSALDGIEVLALYTLKRTSFTITEIILFFNIMIFAVAAFVFDIQTSLYSVLTYFAATRTIDYVVEGIQAYTGVTIISGKSEAIKYDLVNKLGRGITVYKGQRGFLPGHFEESSEVDIIFTVITRLEIRRLKNLVYDVDPNAFVFANTIKEAAGGILKRRHVH